MDSIDQKSISTMNTKDTLKKLNESFGSYKAEWLKSQIFELFAEPSYFPALQDNRPCVLEGGRGTGKTTVLRGLSYQGQFAIHHDKINDFDQSNFIGIYHRVNTNHVRAFTGGNLSDQDWERVFAHYFNLLICRDILIFIKWHQSKSPTDEVFSAHTCKLVANSINIKESSDNLEGLLEIFDMAMYTFQSEINNIIDGELPKLSLSGDPIRIVTEHALNLVQFKDKIFFILLDEYENYEDYQQKIINSLIKHTTENYTFKIGVRELGWRVKHTLNHNELLYDPADYVLVNIESKLMENESSFSDFAKNVCQQRIKKILAGDDESVIIDIDEALRGLTIEEEADLLEVKKTPHYRNYESLPAATKRRLKSLPLLYHFFIAYWGAVHKMTVEHAVADYLQNIDKWDTRYENYKYEMLFKIRKGRGKSGIQKYYSGWVTYTKLAYGNIRYLMELVYRAYEKHLDSDEPLSKPISPRNQTFAAQEAGLKNLMELEGLWKNGAQLTKLLLGLGRVFQVLASSDGKSAPEKNQFSIEKTGTTPDDFEELIRNAVMHLALIRTPGNKMGETYSTRDYLYMIHPLYSAYFQFSHRRKRKINLKAEDIIGVINSQKETIKHILLRTDIKTDELDQLPQQMTLFQNYYNEK
jgi:Cdc6-like AAA superfamily ATPase